MANTSVPLRLSETETLAHRMADGTHTLLGVANALRLLEAEIPDSRPELASVAGLLARVVDQEATAMEEAESFLKKKAVA